MSSYTVECELDLPHRWIVVSAGGTSGTIRLPGTKLRPTVNELAGCNTTERFYPGLDEEMFEDIDEGFDMAPKLSGSEAEDHGDSDANEPSHHARPTAQLDDVKKSKKAKTAKVLAGTPSPKASKRVSAKSNIAEELGAGGKQQTSQPEGVYMYRQGVALTAQMNIDMLSPIVSYAPPSPSLQLNASQSRNLEAP